MASNLPQGDNTARTECFCITGDVGASVFPLWIARHALKLGLLAHIEQQAPRQLDMVVSGPAALLDAMSLACSLGPQEVMVDQIHRTTLNQGPVQESLSNPA